MADDINKERLSLLREINKLTKEINAYEAQGISDVKRRNELNKERIRLGRQLAKVNDEIRKSQRGFHIEAQSEAKSMGSMYDKLKKAELQRIEMMRNGGVLTNIAIEQGNNLADINRRIANLTADQTLERDMLQEQFDTELIKLTDQENISSQIVENLKNQNQTARDYSSLTEGQKEQLEAQLEAYNTIKKTIGGILQTASLLVSGKAGLFGMSLIGAGIFTSKLGEVRSQLGGISEFGTAGLSFFDDGAVDNAKELSNQFGGINNVSTELQASTSLISANMGISGTEAASLLGSFSRLNGNSADTALNLTKSTQEFAKQNGIIPSQLMSDLAESAEEFALFGKEGGQNMIEAGAAARKMGVSLKTMTGISENLLDFESSITKELELGAMLGKNINLNRARSLAYEGDIAGATKETLNTLGGIEAFNKMDYFQKKATADLLGVSVDELQKMVTQQENAASVGGMLNEKFSMASEILNTGLNKYLGTSLEAMGGMVMAGAQFGGSLSQMGVNMGGMVSKSAEFVKNLVKAGASKVFGMFGGAGAKTPDMTPSVGGAGGKLASTAGSGMKGIASGLASLANPATLAGLAALTAAIIGIGFALRIAAPGIEALGTAIGSIITSVGGAVKTVIGGLSEFFKTVASVATPELALSVFGLATSFGALSASLLAFSAAGLIAIPAMLAVGAFANSGVGDLMGGTAGAGDTKTDELITEIKALRADLNSGKIAVYMDGKKVTASVSRVVDKVGTNSYGLG